MLSNEKPRPVVGIDVGGTFTDFVAIGDGALRVHKVATTPDDQSRAVVQGLAELGVERAAVVHGMTVATNALLERRGAKTALLTTAGFGDVLAIGRQNRPHLYRLEQERPPLPAEQRWEVDERVGADGQVLRRLDEAAVKELGSRLAVEGIESLAVVFLFSFLNPAHEQRVAALLREGGVELPISLSSVILPEYREYERTATTVINAYVQPLVARYLGRLADALAGSRVRIMQSNGGAIGLDRAAEQAARLVLSGPAGGVVGAFAVAQQALGEAAQIITFDMGGTSADVALCPGAVPTTAEGSITDLPLRLPSIDIHTVGAGGGSIAYVDAGGGLRCGPRSAGAAPGPACYGRGGTEPTVTDANLVLGRLAPEGFLGGRGAIRLDEEAARRALAPLAAALGLTLEQAALGVVRVANATVERALRRVSVERGHDPRAFTLAPFGGAGPLHACDLAAALGMRRILLPPNPGVLSAYGMVVAEAASDASRSLLRPAAALKADPAPLQSALAGLAEQLTAALRGEGVTAPALAAGLDMRYSGQSYELTVPLALPAARGEVEAAMEEFHQAHARRYGYAMRGESVEAVTVRLRASGPGAAAPASRLPWGGEDAAAAEHGVRAIWFDGAAPVQAACYERSRLRPGNRFAGPALVLQYDATTVVGPGWTARVDEYANLWLEREAREAQP